jgi:DNA-binding response OmpR family regulator
MTKAVRDDRTDLRASKRSCAAVRDRIANRPRDGTFQFGEILVKTFAQPKCFDPGNASSFRLENSKLLRHFIENIGTTFSRDQLLNSVLGAMTP